MERKVAGIAKETQPDLAKSNPTQPWTILVRECYGDAASLAKSIVIPSMGIGDFSLALGCACILVLFFFA